MPDVTNLVGKFQGYIGEGNLRSFQNEYTQRIRPAYARRYANAFLPLGVVVYDPRPQDPQIDGDGGPGGILPNRKVERASIRVTRAVANEARAHLRMFAVAHESGHAVVPLECLRSNVVQPLPLGEGAKLNEHLADLVAMRVLKEALPKVADAIFVRRRELADWLGSGDSEHPSGLARADLIARSYVGGPAVFCSLFTAVANSAQP
jgi:hypothetical protein